MKNEFDSLTEEKKEIDKDGRNRCQKPRQNSVKNPSKKRGKTLDRNKKWNGHAKSHREFLLSVAFRLLYAMEFLMRSIDSWIRSM